MTFKFAVIAVIGLAAGAIGMGAAAGFADASLFDGKPRCAVIAAASHALDWDGGHAILVWR